MVIEWYFIIWFLLGALVGLVNFIFAIKVYEDAGVIESKTRKTTFLVGPGVWAFVTILFGIFAVCVYWLIHYSTLKPNFENELKK